MIIQTVFVVSVMIAAIFVPAAIIVALGVAIIKALGRNPSTASRISVGIVGMLFIVVGISIAQICVIFQLF